MLDKIYFHHYTFLKNWGISLSITSNVRFCCPIYSAANSIPPFFKNSQNILTLISAVPLSIPNLAFVNRFFVASQKEAVQMRNYHIVERKQFEKVCNLYHRFLIGLTLQLSELAYSPAAKVNY